MNILLFVLGLCLGNLIGTTIMAILAAGSAADDQAGLP